MQQLFTRWLILLNNSPMSNKASNCHENICDQAGKMNLKQFIYSI